MAEGKKFVIITKIMRALGLTEEAINDIIEWIEDLLSNKKSKKEEIAELPYRMRDDFLSPAEQSFYFVLKNNVSEWADVCPKVNLGDVFFATCKNFGQRQSYTNKINRKHVDFLLCDLKTAKPILGIELDDKSHNQKKRQDRDEFVEKVFEKAMLPLERFPVQRSYNKNEIIKKLKKAAEIQNEPINVPNEDESKKIIDKTPQATEKDSPTCPKCSAEMTLRTAKSGKNKGNQFWGCKNYPKCKTIIPYNK